MRKFLWYGGIEKSHGAKVACEKVCTPKSEGGLGFKDLSKMNSVLNFKHIWALFSNDNASLWSKWVHTYMLRNKSFWIVKPPSKCSWYWRKLLKLRATIRPLLKHKIGNGCGTYLWYDNWHPLGPLLVKFPPRVAYDAALPLDARVEEIIVNGEWLWPSANSPDLIEIRAHMHAVLSPRDTHDTVIWCPSPTGKYSFAHTWKHIRVPGPKVPWHRLIWVPGNTPRHSFITWLAILNKLSTHDRIMLYTPGPLACVLCHSAMESHNHLFFECSFSLFIWQGILHTLGSPIQLLQWNDWVDWASKAWKPKKPLHTIAKMSFGMTIYSIWKERNDENQHWPLQDPLHVPSGPITRARAKKLKETFSGLIQEIWADSKIPKHGPKRDEDIINLIHASEDMGCI